MYLMVVLSASQCHSHLTVLWQSHLPFSLMSANLSKLRQVIALQAEMYCQKLFTIFKEANHTTSQQRVE